ncbi:TetR/AcrR family transcriptional regulator [Allorhizocola rhizosphaerae]|uniref:TetR/AcrR family transcriptional regulator n=1 Tax=Allorhizocola rhizosphaerae TaxID=1872709 RepID=UPI000E3C1D5E|nr:TetR/AcrR family transcriptional regulator [Allorhizocola rhizosphaerae]
MANSQTRRQLRREETIAQILALAVELMSAEGVAALSLSDVARRLGIQPPSLFKYFPSKLALYDALFAEGARQVLAEFRGAVREAEPGVPALRAAVAAVGRWGLANQALAQLLFWRPVPRFVPSQKSFAPAVEFVDEIGEVLRAAVSSRQLRPEAAEEPAQALLSTLIAGAMTQQMANEPDAAFEDGRFTSLLPRLIDMFVAAHGGKL